MSAEALLAPFTSKPMLDSSQKSQQGAGNLGAQNPGPVRVKPWHHGSCGLLGLFWCVCVWSIPMAIGSSTLGIALPKNCLSAVGVLP